MFGKVFKKAMFVVSALVLGFSLAAGIQTTRVAYADDSAGGGGNITKLTVENNYTYEYDYSQKGTETHDEVTGVKITLPGSVTPKFVYPAYLTKADLASGISFIMTPNDPATAEVKAMKLIFQDSLDIDNKLVIGWSDGGNWYSNPSTYGHVALADMKTYENGYNTLYMTDVSQNTVAIPYGQQNGYSNKGGYGINSGWGTYEGVFVKPSLQTMKFAVTTENANVIWASQAGVAQGDKTLADLKNESFQTLSTEKLTETEALREKYADIISRYTDEYVDNLFPSGKICFTVQFERVVDTSKSVSFLISQVGGKPLTQMPERESKTGTLSDGVAYTTSYIDEDDFTGVRLGVPVADGKAKFTYWNYLTEADLASGITLKMSPDDYAVKEARYMKLFFEDSENPKQKLIVSQREYSGLWYGTASVAGHVSLADDLWFGSYSAFMNTELTGGKNQKTVGNSWLVGGYNEQGSFNITREWGGATPYAGVFENPDYHTFSYTTGNPTWYSNAKPASGTRLMADMLSESYLNGCLSELNSEEHPEAFERFSESWITNLFSSGKIKFSVEFGEIPAGTQKVSFMLSQVGKDLYIAGNDLIDRESPKFATESNGFKFDSLVEYSDADEIAEIIGITVSDNLKVASVEYKLLDEDEEEVTGDALNVLHGYALKAVATDDFGNVFEGKVPLEVGNYYNVTFKNGDGSVMKTDRVLEGNAATAPQSTPVKAADDRNNYSFANWDKEFDNVTADMEILPVFAETERTYTVTWANGLSEIRTEWKYGELPVYEGEAPKKAADAQHTYKFDGWDSEIVPVTGDARYEATFETLDRYYTVTLMVNGVESASEYVYGASVRLEPREIDGKVFVKWIVNGKDSEEAALTFTVSGDVSVTAVYESEAPSGGDVTGNGGGDDGSVGGTENGNDKAPDGNKTVIIVSVVVSVVVAVAGGAVAVFMILRKKRKSDSTKK